MTNIASRPVYGKNFQKHRVLKYYQICSNDDTGLTCSIFMIWSNLFPNASAGVKAYTGHCHICPSLF